MNLLTNLMAKFNSKTLGAFFAIASTWVGLYELNIVLPTEFIAAAILGISFKEGMSRRSTTPS